MKRYLVFSGSKFYPLGGVNDMVGAYELVEEAEKEFQERADAGWDDWAHIYDVEKEIVIKMYSKE